VRHSAGMQALHRIVREHLYQVSASLGLATLCMLGSVAAELLAPWPIKIIFDHVLLGKALTPALEPLEPLFALGTAPTLLALAASIFLLVMIGGAFSYLQLYITARVGHQMVYRLRRELFSRLADVPLSYHHKSRTGDLLLKFASDTSALKDLFADWLVIGGHNLLLVTGMLTVMLFLNWQLSLVVLAGLPILAKVLFRLNRRIKMSMSLQRRQEGQMASRMNEVLSAIAIVQAFGRQAYEEQRFERASAQNMTDAISASRSDAAVAKAIALVSALATAATVLVGSWQVLKGHMTPGDLLVFMAYVRSLYKPIRDLGKLSAKFSRVTVSAQRIAEVFNVESEVKEDVNAIEASHLKGDVVFEKVSFGYQASSSTLEGVSFHIRPGQKVALVGASGAGKSTIVNLILRLYERNGGSIRIDGIDVRGYRLASLRREIGIVMQDTVLFGASIRENISYGKPHATLAEIKAAACEAHADEFIMKLPDGYDTILGERGATLSGGQRQRICLARAIVKQPAILILDEPTSAVDPVSATLIAEAVQRFHAHKTLLVISHQSSSMYQFDKILVLEDGRIIEREPHEHPFAGSGHYHDLRSQRGRLGSGAVQRR